MTDISKIDFQSIESVSDAILKILPQQKPFRFIDRIIEIGEDRIVGQYTYQIDESFYAGHFPGNPVTPGVIQIETMAQTGVVAFGLFLALLESKQKFEDGSKDPVEQYLTLFTDVEAEFSKAVPPGETVTIKAEKVFWRRKKLRVKASMYLANGGLAASAVLSGIGVKQP